MPEHYYHCLLWQKLVKDFVKILNQVNYEKIPESLKLPDSFNQLVSEMKNNKYSTKEFALILKGMVCVCICDYPLFIIILIYVSVLWALCAALLFHDLIC